MERPIYLDHNATTPVDARVIDAMLPCLAQQFGNPASTTHAFGWAAARLVDDARNRIAERLGAHPEEIVFTSGATEADNLAIKGAAWQLAERGRHLVTVATEHKAVLDPCRRLAAAGFEVTVLAVDRRGRIDPEALRGALRNDTILVSTMLANNETGTILPIREVAAICRERGILTHCDATQGVGKIPVDVAALGVDLLSLSAHKIYGPKGVGALVVRRRKPRTRLVPILDGGGHEQGFRSGTLNVAGIVGMARAIELTHADLDAEAARLSGLRDTLRDGLVTSLPETVENGDPDHRLPNTLNVSFAGVDGAALLASLPTLAVSSGSACTSADPSPSHVLLAMGLSRELAQASLRFSLGRGTTEEEILRAVDLVVPEVVRLREGSPLWRSGSGRTPRP